MQIDLAFDQASYQPGQPVALTVHLTHAEPTAGPILAIATVSHLTRVVAEVRQSVALAGTETSFQLHLTPPPTAPRGYGLDIRLVDKGGALLAQTSAAFDVLNHWTEMPRYGFLSDFPPGRQGAARTMAQLVRYHINALQFYDWMYRHDRLLAPQEPYEDLLGRCLSLDTVRELIGAAHERHIAAMPYTAVYAASPAFYEQHPGWALYHEDGRPYYFDGDFLVYMDPRPGSQWTGHLMQEFASVLQQTEFDGIHLDQYGDPLVAWDAHGERIDLAQPLAALIDETAAVVAAHRERGAVVFNCVRNWPVSDVAATEQDIVYIEVWEPYVSLQDLHTLVVEAQELSAGKAVVLAAYVDPAWEPNVLLMDAIIFASGGGHIELGEDVNLLADPYFPKYGDPSPALKEHLQRYYDFAVRYQDLIGPRSRHRSARQVAEQAVTVDHDGVWPIVRHTDGATAINLINLSDLEHQRWDQPLPAAPTPISGVSLSLPLADGEVKAVWMASADPPAGEAQDSASLAARPLPFTIKEEAGHHRLTVTLPSLQYWSLVVVEHGG
jgi:dextranase